MLVPGDLITLAEIHKMEFNWGLTFVRPLMRSQHMGIIT
jgi:hypothetical protein